MQPTENKQPAQEELIAHIRKSLKTHEEPYNLGAWESFNAKKQTKRTPIFWITRLSAAAAIIAVCFTLFLLSKTNPVKVEDNLVKVDIDKRQYPKRSNKDSDFEKIKPNRNNLSFQNQLVAKISSKQLVESKNVAEVNEKVNIQQANQTVEQTQSKGIIDQQSDYRIATITEEKTSSNTIDFLINEAKKEGPVVERISKSRSKNKWVLGLMIAPSLGNADELNMGYGLSMGYNISDKLSLVTGVSYSEMSASKDFTNSIGMSSILYGNNKSLSAVSQKITGLDIPLELKYSFNKYLYANVGVSAFAVIGQSRSNTFIQGVVVNGIGNKSTSSSDLSTGSSNSSDQTASKGQFANTYILNKKIVERVNLEDQNNVNYLGFYNFSIGYKKKMLKRHFVAFEPFVKLPIRNVTQDNLNLVGAGLRLKVDF